MTSEVRMYIKPMPGSLVVVSTINPYDNTATSTSATVFKPVLNELGYSLPQEYILHIHDGMSFKVEEVKP